MQFAHVIIPHHLPTLFIWQVPSSAQNVKIGSLVSVPLKHKKVFGFVSNFSNRKPTYATKFIEEIYNYDDFGLTPQQLNLWHWLSDYYMTTLGQVMLYAYPSLCLPLAIRYKANRKVIKDDTFHTLTQAEELLLRFLLIQKSPLTQLQISKKFNNKRLDFLLKSLLKKGLCLEHTKRTKKLEPILLDMQSKFERQALSSIQQNALQSIYNCYTQGKQVVLLYGVTGSGKTNLYIELMLKRLQQGKQVLFLIPEIVLAEQLFSRLQDTLGHAIKIYHSKISDSEKKLIWKAIRTSKPLVILGTMSSIFLPFTNLSLVICDEEHDTSFKQQVAPYYNARDVGIMLANMHKAKVLLGSATPSLDSYHNAQIGKYGLVSLKKRHNDTPLPEIRLFDLKLFAGKQKPPLWISPPLKKAMHDALSDNDQILIFQNRRGYAPYTVCTSCGYVARCINCNVNLVYHKDRHLLICHYCNTKYAITNCKFCLQANTLTYKSAGTKRVQEIIQALYPTESLAVLDKDAIKKKSYLKQVLQDYRLKKCHILIGTQIIIKGFDFADLRLVVVPDFELLLQFHHFRNNERVMQQMEQVAGRAGRRMKQGTIWIQTNNPNYPLLKYIEAHDYTGFAEQELAIRRQFLYPPFSKMIYLIVIGGNEVEVAQFAKRLTQCIVENDTRIKVIGPAPASVSKIRNKFFFQIGLKCSINYTIYKQQKANLAQVLQRFVDSKISIEVNVDPV